MECKTTSSIFPIQETNATIYNLFRRITFLVTSLFFIQGVYATTSHLNENLFKENFSFNKVRELNSYIDKAIDDRNAIKKSLSNCNTNTYHLFSHGRSGELLINGTWLNAKEIATFLNSEYNIQNSIILYLNIYGCEFAKGEKGRQAVAYIEKTLGIKVNASTNITGKDGDWLLEVGNIKLHALKNYPHSLQTEICDNGIDDDNDGYIDQFDVDCNGGVADETDCIADAPANSNFSIKKDRESATSKIAVSANPIIGDLDGDGMPEIIVPESVKGIHIFQGDGSDFTDTTKDINMQIFFGGGNAVSVAIADVDNNGKGELIVLGSNKKVYVFKDLPSATQLTTADAWMVSDLAFSDNKGFHPKVHDIDEDGVPEIIVGNGIFQFGEDASGTITSLNRVINTNAFTNWGESFREYNNSVVIIDIIPSNPGKEMVAGGTVFGVDLANGALTVLKQLNLEDGVTAVADLDLDGDLDIAYYNDSDGPLTIWDPNDGPNGTLLTSVAGSGQSGGMPFIANVYDDTQDGHAEDYPEVVFLSATFGGGTGKVEAVNLHNGSTPIWEMSSTDDSGETVLTAYDFNGDGIDEIIFRDETHLTVFNGNNASPVVLAQFGCTSQTWADSPSVADVDNDGHAEIVAVCDVSIKEGKLVVFESDGDPWQNSRKVWNQMGYRYTAINDDLSIPAVEQNTTREFPEGTGEHILNTHHVQMNPDRFNLLPGKVGVADGELTLTSASLNCSTRKLDINYAINNLGIKAIPSGTSVAFYSEDPTQAGALLIGTSELSASLDTGETQNFTISTSVNSSISGSMYMVFNDNGTNTLPLVLDDLGNTGISECDYSNNVDSINAITTTNCADFDNDGIFDAFDIDDDNDGILDTVECGENSSEVTNISDSYFNFSLTTDRITERYDPSEDSGVLDGDVNDYIVYSNVGVYNEKNIGVKLVVLENNDDNVNVNLGYEYTFTYPGGTGSFHFPVFLEGTPLDGAIKVRLDFFDHANNSPINIPLKLTFHDIDSQGTGENVQIESSSLTEYILSADPVTEIVVSEDTSNLFGEAGDYHSFTSNATRNGIDAQEIWATTFHYATNNLELIFKKREGVTGYAINPDEYTNPPTKVVVTDFCLDSDGDGIINSLDLDSDDDGCSDLSEASASVSDGEQQTVAGPYGTNGFANSLESPVDSGNATNAENTDDGTLYAPALDDQVLGCTMFLVEDDTATVNEDESVTIDILTNDSDILTSGTLTVTNPANGTVIINDGGTPNDPSDDTVTYTPEANYAGDDSFTYTVCDTETPQTCHTATVDVTVTEENDAPVAVDDTATGTEDMPLTVNILDDDNDVDGTLNASSVTITTAGATDSDGDGDDDTLVVPGEGTWTVDATTGELTFTPEENFNGPATAIAYTVEDDDGLVSEPASVSVSLTAVNDAPIVIDDTATVDEDGSVTIDVLDNDSDAENGLDATTVAFTNTPAGSVLSDGGSTLTVSGEGVWTIDPTSGEMTFIPEANFNGDATVIEYTVDDTDGITSGHGSVSVTVNALNDAPVAVDDTATGTEDMSLTVSVLANDNDVDGTLNASSVTITTAGATDSDGDGDDDTLVVPGEGTWTVDATTGELTFTPEENFNGPATAIAYTVEDDDGLVSEPASVSVSLTAVNDAPIVIDDTATVDEDGSVTIDVLDNDSDAENGLDATTVAFTNTPAGSVLSDGGSTLTVSGEGVWVIDPTTGEITFTPEANFNGDATVIEYTVDDTDGITSGHGSVSVTVNALNDAPVAVDDTATGTEDMSLTVSVLANDNDVDGTLNASSVTITTAGATDSDGDGDDDTLVVPGEGTWTVDATTGELTFTPEENFNGPATAIAYTVEDDDGLVSEPASVSVSLTAVNDAPIVIDDTATVDEDGSVTIDVLDNDSDAENGLDATTVAFTNTPAGSVLSDGGSTLTVSGEGVWVIDPTTGEITFTPEANFNGDATVIEYTVDDTDGITSGHGSVSVTVNALNDAPVAVDDTATGTEDMSLTVSILANDNDVDGTLNTSSVTITTAGATDSDGDGDADTLVVPGEGVWTVDATTGVLTFTPEENFNGPATAIAYTVEDDDGLVSEPATVSVSLNPVDDAPVAVADIATVDEDGSVTIDVTSNDTDVDGTIDPTTVAFVSPPAESTLSADGNTLTIPGEGVWEIDPTTGEITFTPEANFEGEATVIDYTVEDNEGLTSGHGSISVTVTGINDDPVAANDSVTGEEDVPTEINVLANDNDPEDGLDPTTVVFVNAPTGATLSADGKTLTVPGEGVWTIDPATGVVTFTSELHFHGQATSVEYTVSDEDSVVSNAATISLFVTSENDPIQTLADSGEGIEDTVIVISNILGNDTNVDNNLLPATIQLLNPPAGATLSADGLTMIVPGEGVWTVDTTTGDVIFTPEANFNGEATAISYTVQDDHSPVNTSAPTTLSVTVTPVNDVVNTGADIETGVEDMPVVIDVLANDNDVDGTIDPTTVAFAGTLPIGAVVSTDGLIMTVPDEGVWAIDPVTGAITFTPEEDYNGAATSISYTVEDDQDAVSLPTEVSVTLAAINDAPELTGEVITVTEDTPITINPLTNASDAEDELDPTSVAFVNVPAGATLTADGNTLTVPGEGVWAIDPVTGAITFTPEDDFNGELTHIEYTISDTDGLVSEPGIISGTVTAVNDLPETEDDTAVAEEDTIVVIDVLANDTDAEDGLDLASVAFANVPTGSTLSADGDTLTVPDEGVWTIDPVTGVVTFAPEADFNGVVTPIDYTVSDTDGLVSEAASISIEITSVNDIPFAQDDSAIGVEDTLVEISVLDNDTDVEGPIAPETLTFVNIPAGSTLSEDGNTLTIPGEGVWVLDPEIGVISFSPEEGFTGEVTQVSYTVTDNSGVASNPATISVVIQDCTEIATLDCDGDGVLNSDEDIDGDGNPTNDDSDGDGIPNILDTDDDGDGVSTADEDIDGDGDPTNDDSDGDGIPNYLDTDDDGDGVSTADEDIDGDGDPTNNDSDGDGIPNYLDTDDDGDGVSTADEDLDGDGNSANDDSDGDGIPNYLDTDDDGDGVLNVDEDLDGDGDPTNDDSDGDGIPNYLDTDDDGDGVLNSDEDIDGDGNPMNDDSDGDGIPNYLDTDDDGDGVSTADEDLDSDGDPTNDDSDGDGIPNYLDTDDDGDGVSTADEDLDGDGNPANDDSDGDGIPNYLDTDDDGDGVSTADEDLDNDGDPTNDDSDGDGIPNYLDTDDDSDGVSTADEDLDGDGNPANDDSDGDGIPNYLDTDDDGDGVSTADEDIDGDGDSTNDDSDGDGIPNYLDTDDDGDGVSTADEDLDGDGNPANDDSDGDGIPNYLDTDDDGDGVSTADEDLDNDGDPTNDDSDGDGIPNYLDTDDDSDGVSTADEDLDGDGNPMNDDSDGDGIPNYLDTDDDGDGVSTADEDLDSDGDPTNDDSDGDGIPNYLDTDDDGDGVSTPNEDIDGDGDPTNDDSDGDGIPNYLDTDDDGDGVSTADEDLDSDGNPANDDSDGDGIPNYLDTDDDGDGVSTAQELIDETDPTDGCDYEIDNQDVTIVTATWNALDCDGDGETNGVETVNGKDPNDPCSNNGTGTVDTSNPIWQSADCDRDGVTNGQEIIDGTNPTDPCDLDQENQTLTPSDIWYTLECEEVNSITEEIDIEVHNVITPNGDGDNEVFIIEGLQHHPSNTVKIYNRWGVLVYDVIGYNNADRAFKGYSEGRVTASKSEALPVGTYFYVLKYKHSSTGEEIATSGYLYIQQ